MVVEVEGEVVESLVVNRRGVGDRLVENIQFGNSVVDRIHRAALSSPYL